jgi:hypothetical protein
MGCQHSYIGSGKRDGFPKPIDIYSFMSNKPESANFGDIDSDGCRIFFRKVPFVPSFSTG